MENNKIDYMRPLFFSLMLGIMIASFSQSCSMTKASISKYLAPVRLRTDNLRVNSYLRPLDQRSPAKLIIDSSVYYNKLEAPESKPSDTMNYGKILSNQELSLNNEKKIIDMLIKEKYENRKLKQVNNFLNKKSEISQDEKNDAISMKAIWEMGNKIVTLCTIIIGLLIILNIIGIIRFYKSNRCKSL